MSASCTCGCCEGVEKLTPVKIANRPGLDMIQYRVGAHGTFLETMIAALSQLDLREQEEIEQNKEADRRNPLVKLKTRDITDPAIALLDAWATVADVLTFYQERIANEGFLRTAMERRSILELANLVGYNLQPGVAATVYLAFTMEDDAVEEIPVGTRAQSIPGPGEFPQFFETSDPLEARAVWNVLKPRLKEPQKIEKGKHHEHRTIYFKGTETQLKVNDPLLFVFGSGQEDLIPHHVEAIEEKIEDDLTQVTLFPILTTTVIGQVKSQIIAFLNTDRFDIPGQDTEPIKTIANELIDGLSSNMSFGELTNLQNQKFDSLRVLANDPTTVEEIKNLISETINFIKCSFDPRLDFCASDTNGVSSFTKLAQLLDPLSVEPSFQPQNMRRLNRNKRQVFSSRTDIAPQLLVTQDRLLGTALYRSWANTQSEAIPTVQAIHAFRVKAAPFGSNATLQLTIETKTGKIINETEWPLDPSILLNPKVLPLDATYEEIKPGSWIIVEKPRKDATTDIKKLFVESVHTVAKSNYGISAKVTQLRLSDDWIEQPAPGTVQELSLLRDISIYAQSEPLELTEAPITTDIENNSIILDGLFDGLTTGRWAVISGERIDVIEDSEQGRVRASELVMLSGVEQILDETLPGDTPHTVITLANNLAYRYKRDTVTILGNVVRATHGETKTEVLGSGDSSKALQKFELKQSPLTYVSGVTPTGIESSLEVRVNDIEWHETDSLAEKAPDERLFVTKSDNDDVTSVQFGNGAQGARVPTGVENIEALYRVGIGEAGNVNAEQISLLVTKPVGVKSVINPLPATAGANREELGQARRNAPIPLRALDRTVSVPDFADFTRAFTGIGKADAVRISDGRRELVHVTIAGTNDIPIDRQSDLFINLKRALHEFGDPNQPLQVAVRELKVIIIIANVKIHPDFKWEAVELMIRETMLNKFGFENRSMGQDVLLSEVISVMQSVDGVDYVDVDALDALGKEETIRNLEKLDEVVIVNKPKKRVRVDKVRVDFSAVDPEKRIRPAQLAILTPRIPDTLILAEITQ